jgi:hypothetical protein
MQRYDKTISDRDPTLSNLLGKLTPAPKPRTTPTSAGKSK